jgi:hypothetical protein
MGLEKQAHLVGLGQEYDTLFKLTSLQTHGSPRGLRSAYLNGDLARERFEISYGPRRDDVFRVLITCARFLCEIARGWLVALNHSPSRVEWVDQLQGRLPDLMSGALFEYRATP